MLLPFKGYDLLRPLPEYIPPKKPLVSDDPLQGQGWDPIEYAPQIALKNCAELNFHQEYLKRNPSHFKKQQFFCNTLGVLSGFLAFYIFSSSTPLPFFFGFPLFFLVPFFMRQAGSIRDQGRRMAQDLIKYPACKSQGWLYDPRPDREKAIQLAAQYPDIFPTGHSQEVDDQIWGIHEYSGGTSPFYSGIYKWHFDGEPNDGERTTVNFFMVRLAWPISVSFLLGPRKSAWSPGLDPDFGSETFNKTFLLSHKGRGKETDAIVAALPPAICDLLLDLAKRETNLYILVAGDHVVFSSDGDFFETIKATFQPGFESTVSKKDLAPVAARVDRFIAIAQGIAGHFRPPPPEEIEECTERSGPRTGIPIPELTRNGGVGTLASHHRPKKPAPLGNERARRPADPEPDILFIIVGVVIIATISLSVFSNLLAGLWDRLSPSPQKPQMTVQERREKSVRDFERQLAENLAQMAVIPHAPPGVVPEQLQVRYQGFALEMTNLTLNELRVGVALVLPRGPVWERCGLFKIADPSSTPETFRGESLLISSGSARAVEFQCGMRFAAAPIEYRVQDPASNKSLFLSESAFVPDKPELIPKPWEIAGKPTQNWPQALEKGGIAKGNSTAAAEPGLAQAAGPDKVGSPAGRDAGSAPELASPGRKTEPAVDPRRAKRIPAPAQPLNPATGLIAGVPELAKEGAEPSIPCRYVGLWAVTGQGKSFRRRLTLKDDGSYIVETSLSGVDPDAGKKGHWMVQGDAMVWWHRDFNEVGLDINRIFPESDSKFYLIEQDGTHTRFELIEATRSNRCSP